MKERPILFNGEMVRAILEDRKGMTRRIFKPERIAIKEHSAGYGLYYTTHAIKNGQLVNTGQGPFKPNDWLHYCPYGVPGDRLWLRETIWCDNDSCDHEYCAGCDVGSNLSLGEGFADIQYVATPECCNPPECTGTETVIKCTGEHCHGHWWLAPPSGWDGESDYHGSGTWSFLQTQYSTKHPSIHMPRWASRILLEVTEVRVERVQDITEEDAKAEGAERESEEDTSCGSWAELENRDNGYTPEFYYTTGFERLWDSINEKRGFGWDLNPWVWVVTFKRVEG